MLFSVRPGEQRERTGFHLANPFASKQFFPAASDRQMLCLGASRKERGKEASVVLLNCSQQCTTFKHSRALGGCDISVAVGAINNIVNVFNVKHFNPGPLGQLTTLVKPERFACALELNRQSCKADGVRAGTRRESRCARGEGREQGSNKCQEHRVYRGVECRGRQ